MTQSQLNRAVAIATGEDSRTIDRLGFSLADPERVQHDPEGLKQPSLGQRRRRSRPLARLMTGPRLRPRGSSI